MRVGGPSAPHAPQEQLAGLLKTLDTDEAYEAVGLARPAKPLPLRDEAPVGQPTAFSIVSKRHDSVVAPDQDP